MQPAEKGLFSATNKVKVIAKYYDRFDDLLEVYPIKYSQVRFVSFVAFNVMTLFVFTPLLIFFPNLKKTIYYEGCPNASKADRYLLRRSGGIYVERSRSMSGFENESLFYMFDDRLKGFRQACGNLLAYSIRDLERFVRGELVDDRMVIEDIKYHQRTTTVAKNWKHLSDMKVLIGLSFVNIITYLLSGYLVLFAIGASVTLLTIVLIVLPGYLSQHIDPRTVKIKRHDGNKLIDLEISLDRICTGDVLTIDHQSESIQAIFEGIVVEGDEIRVERDVEKFVSLKAINWENLGSKLACGEENNLIDSKIMDGDCINLEEGDIKILVTKIRDKSDLHIHDSRSHLIEALNNTIYFIFVPLWSLYFMYYYFIDHQNTIQILRNAIFSFCPYLILIPSMPALVSGVRRLFASKAHNTADMHYFDAIVSRQPLMVEVDSWSLTDRDRSAVDLQSLSTAEWWLAALVESIVDCRCQLLAVKIQYASIERLDSGLVRIKIDSQGSLKTINLSTMPFYSADTIKRDIESLVCRYRIEEVGSSQSYELIVKLKQTSGRSVEDSIISQAALPLILTDLKSLKPYKFFIDCVDKDSTIEFILVESSIDNANKIGTPVAANKSSRRERKTIIDCQKIIIDKDDEDIGHLAEAIIGSLDKVKEFKGSLLISGRCIKVSSLQFPQLSLDSILLDHSTILEPTFINIMPEHTPFIQRLYLKSGRLALVDGQIHCSNRDMAAEARLVFSISASYFKMMCALSLICLTSMNILTSSISVLNERQILASYELILLPMMIAGAFAKQKPELAREGTKRHFKTERLVVSILLNYVVQFIFQHLMLKALRHQFFYVDPLIYNIDQFSTYDNASIFKINLFLNLGTTIAFSISDPFKDIVWRNKLYAPVMLYTLSLILYVTLANSNHFSLTPLPKFFNSVTAVLGMLSILALVTIEDKINK